MEEETAKTRYQLEYPLDPESEGALVDSLERVIKDIPIRQNRVQFTIASGATSFAVASNYMVLTGAAAVTIATIVGGREGSILTLSFVDGNITITDDATATADTINLTAAFVSTANGILQLLYDGTSWREVGRSIPTDATLATSDITTNNATTSKHGFLKKLSNVATEYMDGTGNFSVPASGWTKLGESTALGTETSLSLTGLTAREKLFIIVDIIGVSAAVVPALRFNNDSGVNYDVMVVAEGINRGGAVGQTRWRLTEDAYTAYTYCTINVSNRAAYAKMSTSNYNNSGDNANGQSTGQWNNTADQITRVDLVTVAGTATLNAGSRLTVFGID